MWGDSRWILEHVTNMFEFIGGEVFEISDYGDAFDGGLDNCYLSNRHLVYINKESGVLGIHDNYCYIYSSVRLMPMHNLLIL